MYGSSPYVSGDRQNHPPQTAAEREKPNLRDIVRRTRLSATDRKRSKSRPCAGFIGSGTTPPGSEVRRVEQMEQGPARKPALPTVSFAAAGAAAVSLAVVAVPWLRMSVEAPSLRVALETGGSLTAVTTVVLLLRQCGLRTRADHLWLTAGLIALAGTALAVAGMIVGGAWSGDKARYVLAGNLAGTLMLAIAAFAPSRKLQVRARTILLGAAARRAGCWPRAGRRARWSDPWWSPSRAGDRADRDRRDARRRRHRAGAARRAAAALGCGRGRARRVRQGRLRALPAAAAPTASTSATPCA